MRGGPFLGPMVLVLLFAARPALPTPVAPPTSALAAAQELPPVGRDAALALDPPPLVFDPPEPEVHEVAGVRIFHLEDRSLPLVTLHARFRGGYAHFPRAYYGAATGLSNLLRNGGSAELAPDSVDALLAHHAIATTFASTGESHTISFDVLREHLDVALGIWGGLLRHPRFDSARIDVWRGQAMERARRRGDDPTSLAYSEFNHLMYGDHPVGWQREPQDLEPDDLARERLEWVHRRIVCPENLVLGATGDISWDELRPKVERLLDGWPPCEAPLPPRPASDIRSEGGVFLIPRETEQSVVIMAQPTDVRMSADMEYFASRVANSILGASGFSSRLLSSVRTEAGLAYAASSLWTAPLSGQGVMGAVTQTRSEATVAATRLVRAVIGEMTERAPTPDELEGTIQELTNGFVFAFDTPAEIVTRRMFYDAEDLPPDWLRRYLEGVQRVEPDDVLQVVREHVDPARMTILVVGDPEAFEGELEEFGDVRILRPEAPAVIRSACPSGAPRCRR